MTQPRRSPVRRSLFSRTLQSVSQLFPSRRRDQERYDRRRSFLFEPLERREVMAGDLDLGEGEGTAPTLAPLPNIVLHSGSPQWVPLDGFDVDGGTLTFTATSSNPSLVSTTIPTGNKSIKMSVAGFGDMYFQLFEHLTPRVTSRIIQLIESGFYDDTATNTITFHRILNDFVIQAGDPTGTGSGGSNLGDFDDQFHVDLQHNRSGLLSMAKSGDDTNDSQFFITEEKNELQFITLAGSPTGGTFTLTYFDQTTAPITFNNSGSFTAMAASIESALESLTRIGVGNVIVTHDPVRNQQNQVTENRRWRVEFTGALGHQEVVNLVGSASGLTGGSNRSIVVDESKSARHLDFNHSIFGVLTQGESVRDAISNVPTNSSGTPANPPVISNVDVFVDPENGALLLKAPAGATGEADITVRVTDAQGNFTERTFHVIVSPDGQDGAPFLNDIGPVNAVAGQTLNLQLTAQDVEGDPVFFDAAKPQGNTVNYTLSVPNNTNGIVQITPPAGFVGSFQVLVGVRGQVQSDTGDQFDTQLVTVNVGPSAPTAIDLLAASDTGFSSSDNITNASSLQLQVSGVTNGALVQIKKGTEVVASGTATGSTITLTLNNFHSLGDGVHSFRATQTVNGAQSELSPALDITLDTTPPGSFTTTPPTEADVGVPLSYNADAPGEGTAGFIYTLTNAPAGATVNGATGQLLWTPAANQVGNHVFQVVATDAAGNSTNQTVSVTVGEPVPKKIEITLTLTTLSGQPLTSLGANQEFLLNAFVKDVRNESQFVMLTGSPTGGTFTLTFEGQTTAPIAFDAGGDFNALAASIKSALEALSNIGVGDVQVTHAPIANGETRRWKVEFTGALGSREVPDMTGNASGLTGGTNAAVSVTESNSPAGASTVYMDILFDPVLAEATGAIQFNSSFWRTDAPFASGDILTPGLINEAGSLGPFFPTAPFDPANPSDPYKVRVFSVPMRAKQSGLLTFTADPIEDRINHPSTVYNENGEVDFEEISYGSVSITVNTTFAAVNDTFNVNEDSTNNTLDPLANDTIEPGSGNVLTIDSVGTTNNGGTVTITNNGTRIAYTPAPNFFGTETFTYTVRNQSNATSQATISIQVQPQNDPPTAVDDTVNVPEDSVNFAIDVLSNDLITPDVNETLNVTAVTQPTTGGTAAVGPGGNSVTFSPSLNFVGQVTFTYTISDGNGGTDTATVTVNVTEANDNPVAVNDTATFNEDSTNNTINVLANDNTGPDTGENLTVITVGQTSNGGTVTIATGGTAVLYTPAPNFQGIETFTYQISDGRGGTATATVTVTVTNANNDPPTAVNDTLNAFKNSPTVLDVLANDTSLPDPPEVLTIEAVTQPAHGTVQITNNGTRITYTPTADYTGPDSFTYTIRDPGGLVSQSATVNLTVQAFVPSSLAGFVYFDVDNDGIKDDSELPIAGVTITLTGTDTSSNAVNRTLKTLADGSYKFDNLAPGNYTITQTQPALTIDGKETAGSQGGTTNTNNQIVVANLAQNVNGVNNNFGERGRQASLITLRDFFASRSRNYALAALDNSGAALWTSMKGNVFAGYSNPTFSLVNNATQIKVEGTNGSSQPVSATLPVTDSRIRLLGTASNNKLYQVSNFNLANPSNNTPPTAVNDTFTATEDAVLNVTAANGVLKNDTDPNAGTTLTAAVVTQPTKGTLTLNANGSFTYTPNANANGVDSFTYRASDGIAHSAPATVTINITAVNDAPVAVNDTYTATRDTVLNVAQAQGVIANDTDVEGSTLTATIVAQPQHGTVTLNANGSFAYTPTAGYTGADSFTYRVSDGSLNSNTATVNLTVNAPNVAPVAVADSYTTNEDTVLNISAANLGVLNNDTDANAGTTLTAIVVNQPLHGQLALNANGTFTYTPAANFNGTDSFTYRASDGSLQSDPVTVTINVTAVNDAPVAVNDSYTVAENSVLTVNAVDGVLKNDTDVESTTLTATIVSQPQHGILTFDSDGSFTYTPNTNFSGTDGFSYTAGDGTVQSAVAAVTINVTDAGEGEGPGDAALLAYLGDEDEASDLSFGDDGWEKAVDEAFDSLA
jgi:large repetitive protein